MSFELRAPEPSGLVVPVPVDPTGLSGPSRGAARGRRWRRTSPGLYVPVDVDGACVEQRIVEQAQRAGATGAVTGWAALRLHGSGFCDGLAADGTTELAVPLVEGAGRVRPHPDVRISREELPDDEVVMRQGIRCTVPDRALYDEVRSGTLRPAVVHAELAVASGIVELDRWAAHVASRPWHVGVRQARVVVALVVGRARSPGEVELRLIWELDAGWSRPLCNVLVVDERGTVIGMPDLLDPEAGLVAEYDGAHHRTRDQHARDLGREHDFRAVGLEYAAFTGPDVRRPERVVERLTAARARAGRSPRRWGYRIQ